MPKQVHVVGVDFTSAPRRAKPCVAVEGTLSGHELQLTQLAFAESAEAYASWWKRPGRWVAGLDHPLSLPAGWPHPHAEAVPWGERMARWLALPRSDWREHLAADRAKRAPGAKIPRRETDRRAQACSPLMVAPVPVALMLHAGLPPLLGTDATVAGLRVGSPERLIVESYPALVARALGLGGTGYKSEGPPLPAQRGHRRAAVRQLPALAAERYALTLSLSAPVATAAVEDPRGDTLDAVFAALQAAWAWRQGPPHWGLAPAPPGEGGIADPALQPPFPSAKIFENPA